MIQNKNQIHVAYGVLPTAMIQRFLKETQTHDWEPPYCWNPKHGTTPDEPRIILATEHRKQDLITRREAKPGLRSLFEDASKRLLANPAAASLAKALGSDVSEMEIDVAEMQRTSKEGYFKWHTDYVGYCNRLFVAVTYLANTGAGTQLEVGDTIIDVQAATSLTVYFTADLKHRCSDFNWRGEHKLALVMNWKVRGSDR